MTLYSLCSSGDFVVNINLVIVSSQFSSCVILSKKVEHKEIS